MVMGSCVATRCAQSDTQLPNGVSLDTISENNRITRKVFADIPGEITPHAIHIEASAKTNEIGSKMLSGLAGGCLSGIRISSSALTFSSTAGLG
jgi:hypothetical protein